MRFEDNSPVKDVRELPHEIAPARDLWPGIEAQIRQQPREAGRGRARSGRRVGAGWFAALGTIAAALVLGVWIGQRGVFVHAPPAAAISDAGIEMLDAAYLPDPQYRAQRAALIASLDTRMKALPPETQEKVRQSLATIHQSMRDIQSALGRAPGDALLGELLINLYQDEMHVLTSVQSTPAGHEET